MSKKRPSLFPGVFLIVLGLWIFSSRIDFLYDTFQYIYPVLLLILAGFLLYETSRKKSSTKLFWGSFLLICGLFFLLRNFEVINYYYPDEYWPVYILAAGVSFIILFISQPSNWGVLIPGFLLLLIGMNEAMRTFDCISWRYRSNLYDFWPVIFIIIGIGLISKSLQSGKDDQDNNTEKLENS